MKTLSATDLAIQTAIENGTLKVSEHEDKRFGGTYFTISDSHGLIEVALTKQDALDRLAGRTKTATPLI